MKLNVRAFALACGLIWALGLFALTWWIMLFDAPAEDVKLIGRIIGQVYRGYSITPIGSGVGFAWAFIDALIGGAIFAWLYNLIATRVFAPHEE